MTANPTKDFATYITTAYDRMNHALWGGQLPHALVTLQRKSKARGYFAPQRFARKDGEHVHEIALNPEHFERSLRDITSTLCHEMAHLWQQEFDKPSRNGYHNKRWAEEMLRVGLKPVSYDKPGSMTGQKVSHEIIEGGAYDKLWEEMKGELDEDALLRDVWRKEQAQGKEGKTVSSKIKYTCPSCGANAWAKPLSNLKCGECDERMLEQ